MSSIQYTVRHPWKWVAEKLDSDIPMKHCESRNDLASALLQPTPNTRRRRKKKGPPPSTVRFDLLDEDGKLVEAHHGTSSALDGLEDKDELVRTFQRCRVEHLGLTPPSTLIRWDVTLAECQNLIQNLPTLEGNPKHEIAVLKEPIGSRGEGIYFVSSVQEIYDILEKNRKRAQEEGGDFLDSIMEQKGRIPSWVLQAEIHPPLLIRSSRKFHLRTYVVAVECLEQEHVVNLYLFNRHEVRIASLPVTDAKTPRDRRAHITNGAFSEGTSTERVLMSSVEELASHQGSLEYFVADTLARLFPDISRRVATSASEQPPEIKKHTLAGVDIMMTTDYRFYLLEVNVNPAAPPEGAISKEFDNHLVGLMKDLKNLLLGYEASNFLHVDYVVNRGTNGAAQ